MQLRLGIPQVGGAAEEARDESEGLIDRVSDGEILQAYQMLARLEGLFVEPASAASVAGVIKLNQSGYFQPGSTIVCILTGHGLKDPDTALGEIGGEPITVSASEDAILKYVYEV